GTQPFVLGPHAEPGSRSAGAGESGLLRPGRRLAPGHRALSPGPRAARPDPPPVSGDARAVAVRAAHGAATGRAGQPRTGHALASAETAGGDRLPAAHPGRG